MQGHHLPGTGGKLDLHHREKGPPRAVYEISGQRIVEHWSAIATQVKLTTRGLRMKAISQKRQQRVPVRKRAEQLVLHLAKPRDR